MRFLGCVYTIACKDTGNRCCCHPRRGLRWPEGREAGGLFVGTLCTLTFLHRVKCVLNTVIDTQA